MFNFLKILFPFFFPTSIQEFQLLYLLPEFASFSFVFFILSFLIGVEW